MSNKTQRDKFIKEFQKQNPNVFRVYFTRKLSDLAQKNGWESKNVKVFTNEKQDAFFFSHEAKEPSKLDLIYKDIEETLKYLYRTFSFAHNVKIVENRYFVEVTDIK